MSETTNYNRILRRIIGKTKLAPIIAYKNLI